VRGAVVGQGLVVCVHIGHEDLSQKAGVPAGLRVDVDVNVNLTVSAHKDSPYFCVHGNSGGYKPGSQQARRLLIGLLGLLGPLGRLSVVDAFVDAVINGPHHDCGFEFLFKVLKILSLTRYL
jgi:hypothetical protein